MSRIPKEYRKSGYLDAKAVAKILGVSLPTAYRRMREMVHVIMGRNIRVAPSSLERYLRSVECTSINVKTVPSGGYGGRRNSGRSGSRRGARPKKPRSDGAKTESLKSSLLERAAAYQMPSPH